MTLFKAHQEWSIEKHGLVPLFLVLGFDSEVGGASEQTGNYIPNIRL